jgi:hypothetical protein
MATEWNRPEGIGAYAFDCGYCGKHTGPNRGFVGRYEGQGGMGQVAIAICTFCGCPTFFGFNGTQVPGVPAGQEVEHLPDRIGGLYGEARRCLANSAPTAAVMACRKILMNVAVEEGASENLRFVQYVDWLEANGFMPPRGRAWVDRIKDVGNEANHEIPEIDDKKARQILSFTEGLLRFAYEFPARAGATSSDPIEDD